MWLYLSHTFLSAWMCLNRFSLHCFLHLPLLHVSWGPAQCFCVITLLIPSRQGGWAPPSTPSLTLSVDSLCHQLPLTASSIQTIVSCLHNGLILLFKIWKSCLSLLTLLLCKSFNFKLWYFCDWLWLFGYCLCNKAELILGYCKRQQKQRSSLQK